ncbi:hypothetical protein C8J56DRAFT_803763 [Mycena floridula]|nr:hypothetical protein C8J56DRAFT_803763 [Mycena floridula]
MPPAPLDLSRSNASVYTLNTVRGDDEHAPLVTPLTPSYGSTALRSPNTRPSSAKLIWNATLKMAAIFVISSVLLGGTLWLALPTLEPDDRPMLKIPKSFLELQQLNTLLKKYRDIYPYRIVVCYVITYLFLQAFSLPGSMYLSILAGAVWGMARAIPLACTCVATGATLCYLISAALGPALLTLPRWKARLDNWATRIQDNRENMISFLIVLRIAPIPPHWVVNVICPHVGIKLVPFWVSTWLGILGVTVIHTTIGGGLDDMTSADDFHLISWKNFFGLAAIVVGVLIPVGLRYWFGRRVGPVVEPELVNEYQHIESEEDVTGFEEDRILAVGPDVPFTVKHDSRNPRLNDQDGYDYSDEEDDDQDVILEAGPAIVRKQGD